MKKSTQILKFANLRHNFPKKLNCLWEKSRLNHPIRIFKFWTRAQWRVWLDFRPKLQDTVYYGLNNIHEKISAFWLRACSAVFLNSAGRVNSVQKEITNQAFWLVNDQRNSQMANQIFCFQIKRTPWMAQFFPDRVIRVRFFCLTISKFLHVYFKDPKLHSPYGLVQFC